MNFRQITSHTTAERAIAAGAWPFRCPACGLIFKTETGYFPYCSDGCAEICPDCHGAGELPQQVTDDYSKHAPCAECDGRGFYLLDDAEGTR